MSLSVEEITAVLGEIAPALSGGRVQRVFQPSPSSITLVVRTPGQTLSLLIAVQPEAARLHILSQKLPNPTQPPAFCQFLRAHIQGGRLEGFEQVPGDRIVRLRIKGREGASSLMAELTGRHADLLVMNREDIVLASLNSPKTKIGRSYRLPVARPRAGRATRTESGFPPTDAPFPISAWIEQRYRAREEEWSLAQQRQDRLTAVRREMKKTARLVERFRSDLEKAGRYQDHARYGELLKANLHSVKKGQDQITLVDYYDKAMPELTIPLEPSKSPQGNLGEYFKKHRKYLAAEREVRPRLEAAERALEAHRAELTAIQQDAWSPSSLLSPSHPSPHRERTPRRRKAEHTQTERKGPFRRFTSVDGLPIYVGRNARENEELTFRFAKSDDMWLHAQGTPGSHVIIRLDKGANPTPDTLKDAATLALLYSDLKKSGKGEVIYTRRKYVRKAKGQSPGTVTVTQEKTLFVTLDKARL
ncbi:MAG: NFACT family protein, partial [Nitrospiraceae bacterium]